MRGLGDKTKRSTIYNYLRIHDIDIALLQEVHSTTSTIQQWEREWTHKWACSHGTSNARGVAVLYNKTKVFCKSEIKDQDGRYIILNAQIEDEDITICNLYGPNEDNPLFFEEVFKQIENQENANLIIGGDFNVTLYAKDKLGGQESDIKNSAKFLKVQMEENELTDIWRNLNPEKEEYTWMRRANKGIQGSRLDFFLANTAMNQILDDVEIKAGCRSDHSMVVATFSKKISTKGPGIWKMNNLILQEEGYREMVLQCIEETKILNLDPITKWENFKAEITKISQNYCQKRSQEKKELRCNLYKLKQILWTELANENTAESETTNETLEMIEKHIVHLEQEKLEASKFRSRLQWINEGEKSTRYFFAMEKRNYIGKTMFTIIKEDGTLSTDQREIIQEQERFYRQIYQSNKEISFGIINTTGITISSQHRNELEEEITLNELTTAIKELKINKTPGCDGIAAEFYKEYWTELEPIIFPMYKEVEKESKFGPSARRGIISLIPKKNKDTRYIKNLRPLTLLNTDYKIMAKAVANRLKKTLPTIIGEQQTGFMEERHIHTNIRKTIDVITHINKTGKRALIVSVDFSKCFDYLEHKAVYGSLRYFGFGENFINLMHIFYTDFQVCTQNNGHTSEFFVKTRSINQGCNISPFVYLLSSEILAHLLIQNPRVKGIRLSENSVEEIISQFADDSALFLDYSEECLEAALNTLARIEKNTGLVVSYEKTTVYRIGSLKNTAAKLYTTKPIKWSDEDIDLLGVQISNTMHQNTNNFNKIIDTAEKLTQVWSLRNLTLTGRIMIINTLIASLFVYQMYVLPLMDKKQLEKLQGILEAYIWKGKKT